MAVTASEARKNLFPLIEKVNADRTPVEITSRRGDAVLMSRADYDALEETAAHSQGSDISTCARRRVAAMGIANRRRAITTGPQDPIDALRCGDAGPS